MRDVLKRKKRVFLSLSFTASLFSEKWVGDKLTKEEKKNGTGQRSHDSREEDYLWGRGDVCQEFKRQLNRFLSSHGGQVEWNGVKLKQFRSRGSVFS